MSELAGIVARAVSATVQFLGVAFAAFLAWLMSGWMVDDSWAERASDADWWFEAGRRTAVGLLGALIVGCVLFVLNRSLAHWKLASPAARPIRAAILGASVVAAASTVGAVMFAIDRPFM